MDTKTVAFKSVVRLAAALLVVAVIGGCATYQRPHYPDSGVYYGTSGGYGHAAGYPRSRYYRPLNPVDYPYWSIDYFYFSQFYHPYSVYVGYNEPLYYPYPGWALGRYRPLYPHHAAAFGFGYPWHGFGYRYPAYTFGFFASYSRFGGFGHRDRHDRHRIRAIDQRLQALQHGDTRISRRTLLARDNVAPGGSGEWYDNRRTPRLQSQEQPRIQQQLQRRSQQSRAGLLQERDRRPGASRSTGRERVGELRNRRRVPERNEIRRGADRRSAADGHRGIPIESLRGRVIVNSRNRAGSDSTRSDRSGSRSMRRAPAIDWGRGESVSGSRRPQPSMDTRSRVLNRSDRGAPSAAPSRSIPRQAPPRAERIDPPSRAASAPRSPSRSSSAPSRREQMRNRSRDNGR